MSKLPNQSEIISPVPGYPWYAVQVQSNFERATQTILRDKGLECYVPTYSDVRKWSDRVKRLDVPLFPGYVFCRLDLNQRMAVLVTPKVYGFVGVGRTPVAIGDGEIDAVKKAAESNQRLRQHPYLRIGERVQVVRGPLAGLEGILLRTRGQFRILLSINILQQSAVVDVDRDCISNAVPAYPLRVSSAAYGEQTARFAASASPMGPT